MLLPHEIEEMERQQDMQERGRRLMDYHRRRLTIPEFIDWPHRTTSEPDGEARR